MDVTAKSDTQLTDSEYARTPRGTPFEIDHHTYTLLSYSRPLSLYK